MAFRSIQQRLFFLLLVPVVLLLTAMGVTGFFVFRDSLLDQWKQNAQMSMERAAHTIDMRLERYRLGITLASEILGMGKMSEPSWQKLLDQLPGVVASQVDMKDDGMANQPQPGWGRGRGMGRFPGMGRHHQARIASVVSPKYDAKSKHTTLGMTFDLVDERGNVGGTIRLEVSFAYLVKGLQELPWWKEVKGYLVDDSGTILMHTKDIQDAERVLGDDGDPLKIETLKTLQKKTKGTILGPGHPAETVGAFYRMKRAPWTLVVFAPGDELLAPIVLVLRIYSIGMFLCLVLIAVLIKVVTGRLAHSISQVSDAAGDVAQGRYRKTPEQPGRDEISRLVQNFNKMVSGLEERDYIRDTFGRYVDPGVARQIMSRPEASHLGGNRREVAIMMTDLRGFTPLCETLVPEKAVEIVNRYFSDMVAVVQKHKGIIVDFVGDAVLAFFDTLEEPPQDAACRAARCALDMVLANQAYNEQARLNGDPELFTGIGLNSGEVVVGNLGSETRTKYGILGSPVNLTNRVQSVAEGGQVVITARVKELLNGKISTMEPMDVHLKGYQGEHRLYLLDQATGCDLGSAEK